MAELAHGDAVLRGDGAERLTALDAVRLKLLFVRFTALLGLSYSVGYSYGAGCTIGALDEGEDVEARDPRLEVEEVRWVDRYTHEASLEVEVWARRAPCTPAETYGVSSSDDGALTDDRATHVTVDRLQAIGVADHDIVAVASTFVGLDTQLA